MGIKIEGPDEAIKSIKKLPEDIMNHLEEYLKVQAKYKKQKSWKLFYASYKTIYHVKFF